MKTRITELFGIQHPIIQGGMHFVGLPPLQESVEALVERLRREQGVAVVPGSPRWFGPGAAGHLRLSFATSEALLGEALVRLAAGLAPAP